LLPVVAKELLFCDLPVLPVVVEEFVSSWVADFADFLPVVAVGGAVWWVASCLPVVAVCILVHW
jgi:hypothetical protein